MFFSLPQGNSKDNGPCGDIFEKNRDARISRIIYNIKVDNILSTFPKFFRVVKKFFYRLIVLPFLLSAATEES